MDVLRGIALAGLLVSVGCAGGDDGGGDGPGGKPKTTGSTPSTGGGTTGGTTSPGGSTPATLEVTCAEGGNALRWECTVDVSPAQDVQLTYWRSDGLSVARTASSTGADTQHVLDLLFLAKLQDYEVEVTAVDDPSAVVTTTFATGDVPGIVDSRLSIDGVPTFSLIGSHIPCSSDAGAVLYDAYTGDLAWYHLLSGTGNFGANDMVQFTDAFTVLGESGGTVVEVDLLGNDVVRLVDQDTALGISVSGIFGNFHHDIFKHADNYYTIYRENFGGFSDLDNVVIFDAAGTELATWRSLDHMAIPGNWSGDFMHTNTVFVDDSGDVYLSLLTQHMVAKFDGDWTGADFGTVLWTMTGQGGSDIPSDIQPDFSALAGPKIWGDQHSVTMRSDGRLQLLDNDNGRALIVSVDEVNLTATVDAEYPAASGTCGPQGTSRETPNGNVLVGCSGDTVREFDLTTQALLWEADEVCSGFSPGSSRWYALDW